MMDRRGFFGALIAACIPAAWLPAVKPQVVRQQCRSLSCDPGDVSFGMSCWIKFEDDKTVRVTHFKI